MDNQKRKSQARTDYKRAIVVLKTIQEDTAYRHLKKTKTKQLEMFYNCLERIGLTMEQIDKLSVIHVTGTKGKGSTCIYVENILRNYGYKTGFFNSPHVIEMRERIIMNGVPLDETLFTRAFWHVYDSLQVSRASNNGLMPGFFVFTLLMAMHVFVHQHVDVVLLEVGIGGQYDATNFVRKPAVCGVTSIHLEHTDVLGNTIEEIAWHKAGIMKSRVPMITVDNKDSVMAVLLNRAMQKQCPVYLAKPLRLEELGGARLGISGERQNINAALAVQLCRLWRHEKERAADDEAPYDVNGIECQIDVISVGDVPHKESTNLSWQELEGLVKAKLPGRGQVVKRKGITYYLDGAHTTDSMQQCVSWFNVETTKEAKQLGCTVYRTLVFRMKKDKPVAKHYPYLLECGFRRAAFCPYVVSTSARFQFADALEIGEDPESARLTALTHLEEWLRLREDSEQSELHGNPCVSQCFPSIVSALWWAGLTREATLQKMAAADIALLDQSKNLEEEEEEGVVSSSNGPMAGEGSHVQVLVTGSLAMVGGALSLLQPEFWF